MSKYVRLKRRDPKHGIVLRQFVYRGIRFLETGGWYVVHDEVTEYLKGVRQKASDPRSPEAFDVCTEAEARKIEEQENIEAKPRRPADNARMTKARGLTSADLRPNKKTGRPKKRRESKPKTEVTVEKETQKAQVNETVESEKNETHIKEPEGE